MIHLTTLQIVALNIAAMLTLFLLLVEGQRRTENIKLEGFKVHDWLFTVSASIMWPVGVITLMVWGAAVFYDTQIWKALLKER